MKLFKKVIAIALCVMMCLSMASFTVSADIADAETTVIIDDKFDTNFTFVLPGGYNSCDGILNASGGRWYPNRFAENTNITVNSVTNATVSDGIFSISGNSSPGDNCPIYTRAAGTISYGKINTYALPETGTLEISAKIKTSSTSKFNRAIFAVAPGSAVGTLNNSTYMGVCIDPTNNNYNNVLPDMYHALKTDSNGNIVPSNFVLSGFSLAPDTWHTIKFVYDLTKIADNGTTPCDIYADNMAVPVARNVALKNANPGALTSLAGLSVIPYGSDTNAKYDDFYAAYKPEPVDYIKQSLIHDDFSSYSELLNTEATGQWNTLPISGSSNKGNWRITGWGRTDNMGNSGTSAKSYTDGEDSPYLKIIFNDGYTGGNAFPTITRQATTDDNGVALPDNGILEVSARIKVPAGLTSANYDGDSLALAVAGNDAYTVKNAQSYSVRPATFYHALKLDENGNLVPFNFDQADFSLKPGKWHKITFVYDLSSTAAKTPATITVETEGEETAKQWTNVSLNVNKASLTGSLTGFKGISMVLGGDDDFSAKPQNTTGIMYDDFDVNLYTPIIKDENAVTLLDEDFAAGVNELITPATSTSTAWTELSNRGVNPSKWKITSWGREDSTGTPGSSAKTYSSDSESDSPYMQVIFNDKHDGSNLFPTITRHITTDNNGVALPDSGTLEVSAKIKVPEGLTSANYASNAVALAVAGNDAYTVKDAQGYSVRPAAFYHALKLDANGNLVPYNFTQTDFSLENGKWHKITFTYDLATTALVDGVAKHPATITVKTEGESYVKQWKNIGLNNYAGLTGALEGIKGISMVLGGDVGKESIENTTGIMYDNFKITLTESFNVNASGAFVEKTGFVADVSAVSVSNVGKGLWCVVGAYGENNALIDAVIADFETIAPNTPASIENITLSKATEANTQKVYVFVWDGSDTMVPYSQPMQIYPAAQ